MKYIVVLILILTTLCALADDAPIAFLPGGTVKPINNNEIQLCSEIIEITLFDNFYSVEVNYVFKNHGKSQTVTMGFPSNKTTKVIDFQASDGIKKFETQPKALVWDFYLNSKYIEAQFTGNPINSFECFSVLFKEEETKKIKNVFKQNYTENYGGVRQSFFYILKTGSLWKDKINEIIVRIDTRNAPSRFKLLEGSFNDKKVSLKDFEIIYKDIEPNFDLFFTVELKSDFKAISASSELKSSQNNKYYVKNLQDENLSTAWVEGVPGYGIGEKIVFIGNMGHNNIDVIALDSIAIINGYAKNENTFYQNSRVKEMTITFTNNNDTDADYRKTKTIILSLKDTFEAQYFSFKTTIKATDLVMTINQVYMGSKYKDTAISEIIFFVKQ